MKQKSTTKLDKTIGANISTYRHIRGLTRQALAEQIGVTFQQFAKYEEGKNRISASRLFEVAQILNQPIHRFTGKIEINQGEALNSRQVLELVKNFLLFKNDLRVRFLGLFNSIPKG